MRDPIPWLTLLILTSVVISPNIARANPPPTLTQQAQQSLDQGNFVRAEALWRQVVQRGPTAQAYYNLGLSLHQQLKLTDAIQAYTQATKIDPHYGSAYLNLGMAWLDARNDIKAEQAFQQVLSLANQPANPASTHTLAHYDLAIIYKRQGKFDLARQAIREALALTPNFAPAQQLLQQLGAKDSPNPG
jgi:tetratricopeptide (TPR) repeat protein